MENENDDGIRPTLLIAAGGVTLMVLVGVCVAGVVHFRPSEWADFGTFVAGTAGVALTAFTFLAVLYTIRIQSRELSLSRQELTLTREEMANNRVELARSAEALDQQATAIDNSNFERTLFESLQFLNRVVSELEYRAKMHDHPMTGAQAFVALQLDMLATDIGALGNHAADEIGCNPQLNQFFDKVRPLLGTYLRTLYNIYRYLKESNYADREFYNRIIRAQIPDHALPIIFYNSLTNRGLKLQKYIVEFDILDNLPTEYLANPLHAELVNALPTPRAVAAEIG